MTSTDPRPPRTDMDDAPRQPGWAVLLGMLAIALLVSGGVLLAMIQAPGVHRGVLVAAGVLVASGFVLLPIAWRGRRQ